jgi:hypothetical protein
MIQEGNGGKMVATLAFVSCWVTGWVAFIIYCYFIYTRILRGPWNAFNNLLEI